VISSSGTEARPARGLNGECLLSLWKGLGLLPKSVLVKESPFKDSGCPCGRDSFPKLSLWKMLLSQTVLVEGTPCQVCPCGRDSFLSLRLPLWKLLPFPRLLLWKMLLSQTVLVGLGETPSQDSLPRRSLWKGLLPKTVLVEGTPSKDSDCPCGRDSFPRQSLWKTERQGSSLRLSLWKRLLAKTVLVEGVQKGLLPKTVLVEETPQASKDLDCPCGRDSFPRLFLWKGLLLITVLVEETPLSDCPCGPGPGETPSPCSCGRDCFPRLSLWKRLPGLPNARQT
jgi:hypothetical protein